MIYLLLFWEFFKTGLFAIGGGLATIPFLKEIAAKYGWFTIDTLTTMIAVSESTPGPIGVNMATYVGYETAGVLGAIVATVALVLPSLIIICIIAKMLQKFRDAKIVQGIFVGLRPAVVGFIISACVTIFLTALFRVDVFQTTHNWMDLFQWKSILLFMGLCGFYWWKPKLHPIVIILIAACVGMLFQF